MRRLLAVSLLTFISGGSPAAPAPLQSWGKAGITLVQYRQDAVDCALSGHYTDISQTNDAKEFLRASRELDTLHSSFAPGTTSGSENGPAGADQLDRMGQFAASQQHVIDAVRPGQRYKSIKRTLEAATAECLEQRGYSRFALTDEQRRQLGKLKAGSDERRAFLYSLASNPSVLQLQHVATSAENAGAAAPKWRRP